MLRSGDTVSDWAALGLRDDVPAHVVIVTKYEPSRKDFIIKAIRCRDAYTTSSVYLFAHPINPSLVTAHCLQAYAQVRESEES